MWRGSGGALWYIIAAVHCGGALLWWYNIVVVQYCGGTLLWHIVVHYRCIIVAVHYGGAVQVYVGV